MRLLTLIILLLNCYFNAAQAQIAIKNIIAGNVSEIYQAIDSANKRKGYTHILIKDGTYQLPNTLVIKAPAITLASLSGDRNKVILNGNGMKKTANVDNLIYVAAAHFTLTGITLQHSGNHLIQVSGADNPDYFSLSNCVLRDSFEQLLKVSYGKDISADYGVVKDCVFEYSAGIGPQWYIGGIDAHGIQHWSIRNNTFKNIASPSYHIAEHAIHIWNNSAHNIVEDNVIFDCDRGIGFGMQKRGNLGGTIQNNIITHANNADPFADVGIILENSPDTLISNNYLYLSHSYPNAIEYRFSGTKNAIIQHNITNKKIANRNGADAFLHKNKINQPREIVLPKTIQTILTRHFSKS
jgi:hypothetical protein